MPSHKVMLNNTEAAILRSLGSRIREARQLSGFTIHKAARLLGVEIDLFKRLEAGALDIDSVSLRFVKEASELFDVSTDYLFDFAGDDWERCFEVKMGRSVGQWVHKEYIKELSKLAVDFGRQQRQIEAIRSTTTKMLEVVSNLNESVERFRELNKDFNDLPGGAQLLNRAKIATEATQEARCQLVRCKIIPRPIQSHSEAK